MQYGYDEGGRLAAMELPEAGYVTWNGYEWMRPSRMLMPGGTEKEFAYDPLMRVKQIQANDVDGNVLMNYRYDYDNMDNIVEKATEHGDYAYGYDDLYRLVTADNPVLSDEGFSYDPVGNRLTDTQKPGAWTYNDNNELLSAPFATFTFDANGSTIGKIENGVVWTYTYNVENRMTAVESLTVTAQYYYDPFGLRLWKEVDGIRTYYMYSDEGLAAEIDATGTIIKTYGYKPDSTWTTDPIYINVDDTFYFYQNDHLGTPQQLISLGGDIVQEITYESFGKGVIDGTSSVTSNLRFAGQYYDAETGLHYNWNRYYDPGTGRYLTTDPVGLGYGSNLYVYANSNSINLIDPEGEIAICATATISLAYTAYIVGGVGLGILYFYYAPSNTEILYWLTTNLLNEEKKGESDDSKKPKTGKTDKHSSEEKRKAAEEKYKEAKSEWEKLKSSQKREKGHKKLEKKAYDKMMKHKRDMDYTGDTDWRKTNY